MVLMSVGRFERLVRDAGGFETRLIFRAAHRVNYILQSV
jgi:hypothetical protein